MEAKWWIPATSYSVILWRLASCLACSTLQIKRPRCAIICDFFFFAACQLASIGSPFWFLSEFKTRNNFTSDDSGFYEKVSDKIFQHVEIYKNRQNNLNIK